MDSEILTAPAEAIPEPVVSPPAPRIARVRAPGQMSYSDLRKRIKELESALASRHADPSRVVELTTRLEQAQAETYRLSARLAAYDHAEAQLRQAADAHVAQSLVLFNARAVAVRAKFPDFDAVIESKPELRQDLLRAVVQMEQGPFVLYFLIKSPDLCRQLNPLPLGAAIERIFHFVIQVEQQLIQESVAANYLAVTKGK
jgi:hypothetical protein